MRILFLSTVFPDVTTPTRGTYNLELCRALAEQHEVKVIAPQPWPVALRNRRNGKVAKPPITCQQSNIEVHYPTYWYPPKVMRAAYGAWMYASVQNCVRQLHRRFKPDFVFSYWAHPDGEAGLRVARISGVPSAVIAGGSDVLLLTDSAKRRDRIVDVLSQSTVLSVSDGLKQHMIGMGIDEDRIHVLHQGIDPRLFHANDRQRSRELTNIQHNEPALIWVGRVESVKGLYQLLRACKKIREANSNINVHIIGDGPLRSELQQQAVALGIDDRVHFEGAIEHSQLPNWYRAADGFVMSSRSEGLPNVLREALACGTPFVSTDVGSISEIADHRFSVLVPPGDIEALADGMQRIVEPNYQKAAQQYRARTWNDCANDLLRIMGKQESDTRKPEVLNSN